MSKVRGSDEAFSFKNTLINKLLLVLWVSNEQLSMTLGVVGSRMIVYFCVICYLLQAGRFFVPKKHQIQ